MKYGLVSSQIIRKIVVYTTMERDTLISLITIKRARYFVSMTAHVENLAAYIYGAKIGKIIFIPFDDKARDIAYLLRIGISRSGKNSPFKSAMVQESFICQIRIIVNLIVRQ